MSKFSGESSHLLSFWHICLPIVLEIAHFGESIFGSKNHSESKYVGHRLNSLGFLVTLGGRAQPSKLLGGRAHTPPELNEECFISTGRWHYASIIQLSLVSCFVTGYLFYLSDYLSIYLYIYLSIYLFRHKHKSYIKTLKKAFTRIWREIKENSCMSTKIFIVALL